MNSIYATYPIIFYLPCLSDIPYPFHIPTFSNLSYSSNSPILLIPPISSIACIPVSLLMPLIWNIQFSPCTLPILFIPLGLVAPLIKSFQSILSIPLSPFVELTVSYLSYWPLSSYSPNLSIRFYPLILCIHFLSYPMHPTYHVYPACLNQSVYLTYLI